MEIENKLIQQFNKKTNESTDSTTFEQYENLLREAVEKAHATLDLELEKIFLEADILARNKPEQTKKILEDVQADINSLKPVIDLHVFFVHEQRDKQALTRPENTLLQMDQTKK